MALHWIYLGDTDLSKLTDEQREFYDTLIWCTIFTDIGYICEESAEEFCRRANLKKIFKNPIKPEDLKPYFGIRTNVSTISSAEWALKCFAKRKPGFGPAMEFDSKGRIEFKDAIDRKWADKIDDIAYSKENEEKARKVNEQIDRKEKETKDVDNKESQEGSEVKANQG